jgi:hypothetical protein
MKKPDFLVIGAQKCATSWLHHHLGQQPQIMLPVEKDIEFFSYTVNLNPDIYRAWLERFDDAREDQRIGDVNAAYFWTETASQWGVKLDGFNRRIPEAVQAILGDQLQLIVSLRNPVERAVSAYLHHIVHGAVEPGQRLLEIDAPLGIVDMGFYGAHLQNWLRVFSPRQFLLIDGLASDRAGADHILSGTLEFLGVAEFSLAPEPAAVFPGMPRIFKDDGVWVPVEHPAIAGHLPLDRPAPQMDEDGSRYTRLIERPELVELEQIYRQDQDVLRELLTSEHISVLDPHSPDTRLAE